MKNDFPWSLKYVESVLLREYHKQYVDRPIPMMLIAERFKSLERAVKTRSSIGNLFTRPALSDDANKTVYFDNGYRLIGKVKGYNYTIQLACY